MDVVEENENRVGVVKRVHLIIVLLYSVALAFNLIGFTATLSSNMRERFLAGSVVLSVLIVLHLIAKNAWEGKPNVAWVLSCILGFMLLFAFPLGTIFGGIILYKLSKLRTYNGSQQDIA